MNAAPRLASPVLRPVERHEDLRLGMRHLAPVGLSEPRWLRDGGDRHWELIAEALGQEGTAFRDPEGHAVYAAFCATDLQLAPVIRPLLAARVTIRSRLHAVSPNALGSEQQILGPDGPLGCLRMISCFLRHDETGSNRRLLRGNLPGMAPLPPATAALDRLQATARCIARLMRRDSPTGPAILRYKPVPTMDFNAAGLLYFPTFSKIAEMACPGSTPLLRRQIVYLGNLDPGEDISVEAMQDDGTATTLLLRAKGRVLAQVTTQRGQVDYPTFDVTKGYGGPSGSPDYNSHQYRHNAA
ncbi:Pnap_2097 family protein [Pararhodobacter sp. CCB-MM2]|uniref:Pnap_2097 family protein n=1 Tax=Pararhodobacter sp. CCB-MM2 TaxID=1786003 RepID=UPI00083373B4|nr:Pnap_2097 family protein [Pararhodobacter sp. CCB-MM2]